MDRLKMHSVSKVNENIKKITKLFSNTLNRAYIVQDGSTSVEHAIETHILTGGLIYEF